MWIITHKHSGNKFYLISEVKKYLVGRFGSDVVLTDDTSISRSHAVFYVTDTFLKLEDLGSKYGTYYNENIESRTKLPKGQPIQLHEGDRLLFGALKNEWQISKYNITSMTSSVSGPQLNELKSLLNSLGGTIISKWEPRCSHLTMSEITITIKVLHALIEKIPIVSCVYWKDYLKNLREKKPPPKAALYLPERSASLSSAIDVAKLNFNDKRKTLFAGKIFVFMSNKHNEMYSPIVLKAGGECKDLKNNIHKSYLLQKNVVVVKYVPSTQSQSSQAVNTITEYLEASSLRAIPEHEIGLAIVCCTTEKYCNPSYSPTSNILPNSAGISPNIGTLLAENTRPHKSQYNTSEFPVVEIPDSDALTEKVVLGKPVQSEIYEDQSESGVISIENSEGADGLDEFSQIAGCHLANEKKRKRQNIEEHEKELPVSKKVNVLAQNSFSGNLFMSSDMPSNENEILSSSEHPASKNTRKQQSTLNDFDLRPTKKTSILASSSTTSLNTVPEKCVPLKSAKNQKPADNPQVPQSKSRYSGFLEKSQIAHSHRDAQATNTDEQQETRPRTAKRGRIARITDNDSDNEDDIFNFGEPLKKSKASNDNSDDELFGGKPSEDEVDRVETQHEEILAPTQRFIPNKRLNPKVTRPIINVSPMKVSSDGWLSKLDKLKIKCDEDDELKKENDVDDPKHNEWIESIKGGFEVRVRKMNLSSKGSNSSTAQDSSDSTLNTNKKNFKAFVKKRNYKPQTLIVRTVSMIVPPIH